MEIVVTTKEELQGLIEEFTKKAIETYFRTNNPFEKEDLFLTIEAAAQLIRVSKQTIRNYIEEDHIEAHKIKRRVLIPTANLLSILNEIKSLKYKK